MKLVNLYAVKTGLVYKQTGVPLETNSRCVDNLRKIQVPTTIKMAADIFHELPFTAFLNLKMF